MKQYIKANIQNLGKSEILEIIPEDTLKRIKQTDKRPEFKVYCIGHEGTAHAQELSFGQKMTKAFHYVKDMILKINEKLQIGTAIFNRHVDTNEHSGREQIGELVGKTIKTIGDKISALAAVYIYPQYRKLPLDVASIESNVVYVPKSRKSAEVIDIDSITGIALSSSGIDKPAFPGATLLGIVQAFAKGDEEGKMTREEILEAIKENGFKVTDLFSAEDIATSEPAKKTKQTEYEHAKRIEKALGEEREKVITLTKQNEESQGKIKKLNEAVSATQVKSLFETAHGVRKFNDKEKAFIEKNLGGFKSEKDGDDLKKDFDIFLDNQIKEFGEVAKIMGIEPEKKADPNGGNGGGAGAPNDDGKGGNKSDMTTPENNDFIPKE